MPTWVTISAEVGMCCVTPLKTNEKAQQSFFVFGSNYLLHDISSEFRTCLHLNKLQLLQKRCDWEKGAFTIYIDQFFEILDPSLPIAQFNKVVQPRDQWSLFCCAEIDSKSSLKYFFLGLAVSISNNIWSITIDCNFIEKKFAKSSASFV